MTGRRRRSDRVGRAPLFSPGRPVVAGRDQQRRFWAAIAAGMAGLSCRSRCGSSGSGPPRVPSRASRSASCPDACGRRPVPAIRDRRRCLALARVRRRGCAFTDDRDLSAGDADIDKPAIGEAAIGQECVDLRRQQRRAGEADRRPARRAVPRHRVHYREM